MFKIENKNMSDDIEDSGIDAKVAQFFQADYEARKKAGLENKAGTYTFECPNCKTLCSGRWIWNGNHLHGKTGCTKCNIHLIV